MQGSHLFYLNIYLLICIFSFSDCFHYIGCSYKPDSNSSTAVQQVPFRPEYPCKQSSKCSSKNKPDNKYIKSVHVFLFTFCLIPENFCKYSASTPSSPILAFTIALVYFCFSQIDEYEALAKIYITNPNIYKFLGDT